MAFAFFGEGVVATPRPPPPSCPYEGWLRQIIRDAGELEPCIREKELRILLIIDDQGRVDDVQVLNAPPQESQQCATRVVRSWEFASGKKPGTIQIVLERRSSEGAVRRVEADERVRVAAIPTPKYASQLLAWARRGWRPMPGNRRRMLASRIGHGRDPPPGGG